jgi:hypothetical protein
MLKRFFKLDQAGSTVGRELQAGLTTFAAMAYILVVNPDILANTGMDKGALVTVTAAAAATAATSMPALSHRTRVKVSLPEQRARFLERRPSCHPRVVTARKRRGRGTATSSAAAATGLY